MRLPAALAAWSTSDFAAVLKRELIPQANELPLQQALTISSVALTDDIDVTILASHEAGTTIEVRLGVFFSGIVAGCNCADDPTPVERQPEYCELQLAIDKTSAEAAVIGPPA